MNCLNCGESLIDKRNKYCDNKCQRDYQWDQRKKLIEINGFENSDRAAKKYLLETRGHSCEICYTKEWCGQPIPLILDHIDGNSNNNNLNNLRLVCGNCDMQLPTYKNKNKGNGRYSRKVRYQEGKSY